MPVVIISSPFEVKYAFKRVSRQNPGILPFQSQECLDLSKEWSFVGNGHKDISPGLNILEKCIECEQHKLIISKCFSDVI